MKPRDLFILALRICGIWTLVSALEILPFSLASTSQYVEMLRAEEPPDVPRGYSLATIWAGPAMRCLAGGVLLWLTPWIASRFYSRDDEAPAVAVSRGDVLSVALALLGVYASLLAVPSVAGVLTYVVKDVPFSGLTHHEYATVVEAVLYLGGAGALFVGAKVAARAKQGFVEEQDDLI